MAVTVYKSSDVGAPPLRGNSPGDLIALLKACLVDGYGSKPGAGWTQAFVNGAGTIAAFKQGVGTNGMYLRVDDSQLQGTANGYRNARVVGYESMSSIDAGLPSSFPSESSVSGGLYWLTMYGDSTGWAGRDSARPWVIVADEGLFYFWLRSNLTGSVITYNEMYFFGDIISYKGGDSFGTCIRGNTTGTNGNSTQGTGTPFTEAMPLTNSSLGFYLARDTGGTNIAPAYGHHIDQVKSGALTWGGTSSTLSYPNAADGAAYLCPVWVHEPGTGSNAILRGQFPGLWSFCHTVGGVSVGDEFNGQGQLAGKRLVILKVGNGVAAVEIGGSWRG